MRKAWLSVVVLSMGLKGAPLLAQGGAGAPPPPEISYVTTKTESVPLVSEFVGVSEASHRVEVRARIKGFLEKRFFTEGATVTEGDLLYTIDARQFAADVQVVEARLDQAKAMIRVAEASREQAQATLNLSTRDYERYQTLSASGGVSEGDLDRARKELDSARANLASATAQVSEAEASMRLVQAELDKARLELSYTEIHAPLTGIIGKSMKEPGSLVDDGDDGILTQITQLAPIYVSINISEPEYLAWKSAGKSGEIVLPEGTHEGVQVILQNGTAFGETGRITYESPAFDTTTGTFEVRAEFPNADAVLRPGQFLKVILTGWERPSTISVPQRSVNQMPSGSYVYVVDSENKIEFRPVKVGKWTGNQWVIQSGLKEGERVLVDGFMKVRPGMVTQPVPHQNPAAAAAPAPAAAGKE